jgi:SAM-dependent methyltransferase
MRLKWRAPGWAKFYNHNEHYAPLVLRQRTPTATIALDVGCGDGRYTVRLPDLGFDHVVGIDPAPDIFPNDVTRGIEWVADDFLTHDFGGERFEFIIATTSIHHMSFNDALRKMRELLAPEGSMAILGLYRPSTLVDRALDVPAFTASQFYAYTRMTTPTPAPVREPTMTLREVAHQSASVLPDRTVRRLLMWRYLLTWTPKREAALGDSTVG